MGIKIKSLSILLHEGFHNMRLKSSDLKEKFASCLIAVCAWTPFHHLKPKKLKKAEESGFCASLCLRAIPTSECGVDNC